MRGPRAQQDRELYRNEMQRLLAGVRGLEVVDGCATDLVLEAGRRGRARAVGVVLSTGAPPEPLLADLWSLLGEGWRLAPAAAPAAGVLGSSLSSLPAYIYDSTA